MLPPEEGIRYGHKPMPISDQSTAAKSGRHCNDVLPHQQQEMEDLVKEFADIFASVCEQPPDRGIFHPIRLQPGTVPPFRRTGRLSVAERAEVEKQVKDLLAKGLIEPSCSPFAAPNIFVQKQDQSLRMCLDLRALNKCCIRDRYMVPRISELLDQMGQCCVFTSIDLQQAYNQVLIPEEDRPKTAFVTHMGQYQYKVLCFGFCNAPATFQ